jgi:hypothetical protein
LLVEGEAPGERERESLTWDLVGVKRTARRSSSSFMHCVDSALFAGGELDFEGGFFLLVDRGSPSIPRKYWKERDQATVRWVDVWQPTISPQTIMVARRRSDSHLLASPH